MRVNLLSHIIEDTSGDFSISVKMGLYGQNEGVVSGGIRFGIIDQEDPDFRAAVYFGKGIEAGISSNGYLFLGGETQPLPPGFDLFGFKLSVRSTPSGQLIAEAADFNNLQARIEIQQPDELKGLVAVFAKSPSEDLEAQIWFDEWEVRGSAITSQEHNRFGPILWTMYTVSRNILKLAVQMPPLSSEGNHNVDFQLWNGNQWITRATTLMDPDARIALFRLEDWDSSQDRRYRVFYSEKLRDGTMVPHYFEGEIRAEPLELPLAMGGLTCQHGAGFPYTPLVEQIKEQNVDLLYFSGDQIYEGNGGYGITRFPADRAILNYLGKWYMFGWAFRDLMRDRPTIVTPDDHDVFQGNLWGENGKNITLESWNGAHDDIGGYVQPARMVNVVHRTQTSHLPDPYDPTPIEQGILPFYTDLTYGRVSFAILSDRMFKSSPNRIANWEGRADHVVKPLRDPSILDKTELKLLGERQLHFLEEWVSDWSSADFKTVLSQTPFANIATHHGGNQMVLNADLDSGGWPRSARNRAIELMRKAFAFHITGDQHLPTFSQYGIAEFRDSGWVFCTPAIYVGYERRFQPERIGLEIENPPGHQLPNTGEYRDGLGNPQYVYAVGNPEDQPQRQSRYQFGQDKASGFGVIKFQKDRNVQVHAYRFLPESGSPGGNIAQFPGWPATVNQFDNYGKKAIASLPEIQVQNMENPVIHVSNEKTGELVYAVRILGRNFAPKVFSRNTHSVRIGDPDTGNWKTLTGIEPGAPGPIQVVF